MRKMTFRRTAPKLAAALAAATVPGLVAAQSAPGVGDIGLTLGHNAVEEQYGDSAGVLFGVIEGSYSFPVGERMLLGLDANWRMDNLASDEGFDGDDDPESRAIIGARALWSLGSDTRLGGFVAYGATKSQGMDSEANYDYWLAGVEARHFFGDRVMGYGQLGFGDKVGEGEDEGEGFYDGQVLRLGATWFASERTALTLDVELAHVFRFIDGEDTGAFYAARLSGETRLGIQAPLMATYSLAFNRVDATTEDDSVDEVEVGLGIRYLFGAGSSQEAARAGRSIGLPQLPGRGSAWTEYLD